MGPGDDMIVPGDLEGSCNMVSYISSDEGKTYRSICDNWTLIVRTEKIKPMLRLIDLFNVGL